jgi:hydrogenase-4 component E
MNHATYVQLLNAAVGAALVAAVLTLWRRSLVATVRILACQGVAVAATGLLVGIQRSEGGLIVVAGAAFVVKVFVIPLVLLRVVRASQETRESEPLVNVSVSLVAAAILITLAFSVTDSIVALAPSPASRAIPFGFAIAFIGFFALVTRRKAISQIVGFLLLENGIALVAILAAPGGSVIVELGAALDVLLAVLVLQVLVVRMRTKFGALDLDQLQELRD